MPTVTSLNITFSTTGDDKDWNTKVMCRVVVRGQDVATLYCCDQNRTIDHWDNNTTTSRLMTIVTPIDQVDMRSATFVTGMIPVGNDGWKFVPTLTATYDQGPPDQWTWGEISLASDNSLVSVSNPIPPR